MADPLVPYIFFAVYGTAIVLFVGHLTRAILPALLSYIAATAIAIARFNLSGVTADAAYYDRLAVAMLSGGTDRGVSAGKEGFSTLLSGVYDLFGHHPILGLWLNAVAVGLTVCVMATVARRFDMSARATMWLTALYPAFYIWGTLLLRESITWFFLALLTLAAAGLITKGSVLGNTVLMGLAFAGLLTFRGSVAIAVIVALIAAVVVARRGSISVYVVLALAVAVVFLTPLADQVDAIFGRYNVEQLDASREALQRTADSAFSTGSGGPIAAVISVLPRVLFGPFVWEVGTVGPAGIIDGLLWVALLLTAIYGFKTATNKRALTVLVFPAVTLLMVLALTSGNYGTMVRLRVQVAIFLIPLAAAGLATWKERRRKARSSRGYVTHEYQSRRF